MSYERLLDVRNLEVEFNTEVGAVTTIDDVSFHIEPGEAVVIVGESGSGNPSPDSQSCA